MANPGWAVRALGDLCGHRARVGLRAIESGGALRRSRAAWANRLQGICRGLRRGQDRVSDPIVRGSWRGPPAGQPRLSEASSGLPVGRKLGLPKQS